MVGVLWFATSAIYEGALRHTIVREYWGPLKSRLRGQHCRTMEDLMIFDARCLDGETRHALQLVLPDLTRIRKAWRAHFTEHGCVSYHRKKTEY